MKAEWNSGYEKGRDDYCCNHNCNQGRDCPLRKVEPVAWRNLCVSNIGEDSEWIYNEIGQGEPLYTHPVKELTDEEIEGIAKANVDGYSSMEQLKWFARAILRKAQEK